MVARYFGMFNPARRDKWVFGNRDTSFYAYPRAFRACLSRLPGKRARPVLRGPRRSNAPGLPDEAQFTALRYFTLDGTDHANHTEQASMIRRYIAWRNRHTHDPKLRRIIKRANVA